MTMTTAASAVPRPPAWPWLAAAALSGALAIAAALLGHWPLLAVAKPLTTILIIAGAWQRGGLPRRRAAILAGLVLSLVGDVALLWPKEGFLIGLVAFLLAHLAYLVAFTASTRLAAKPLAFAAYAVVAGLLLWQLWPGVPGALRLPVVVYVVALASMAAQATCWALAEPDGPARSAAIGGALFVASDATLAFNKFAAPFALAPLAILLTYWSAQALIALALPPRGR
ncbi:lysoplasmalogenase [Rivibacter subsaxonicus]|uniref:Putative membrane protein YhhN n=1 Tax=Rivibacter subsaxonicus TaxID=457575 RepID=A0A4Q7VWZ4_9BURK|nr:lysoplasmalogenase [Rivibacter subsaxonicus]RZU01210.1 putative membrane protein YhhN [Rivibacter subsaxonicus]